MGVPIDGPLLNLVNGLHAEEEIHVVHTVCYAFSHLTIRGHFTFFAALEGHAL